MTPVRQLLPMQGHTRGKRSAVTCALKCDNACAKATCNTSDNSYFRDIASAQLTRRSVLGAGAAGALAVAVTSAPDPFTSLPASATSGKLKFSPIAPVDAEVDGLIVPKGYTWHPIIRWGDPIYPDAPAFNADKQTEAAQKKQFGYNNDYAELQIVPGSNNRRALFFSNHEYTNENIMFPESMPEREKRAIGRAAHGLTVVELTRKNRKSPWGVDIRGRRNRRFVMETEYAFTGPAAGSELLQTRDYPDGDKVQGTLGNCAGGLTPWGTLLSGEENFNSYFTAPGTSAEDKRYGLTSEGTARGWEKDLRRFSTKNRGYENETNRFGYIVEVDPWDPNSTPVKHTSLGRFKHEGANVIVADDGRVVAYSGDDEKFDYLYKFVSKRKYRQGDKKWNMRLLAEGDLYVAKFTGDSPADQIDGSGRLPDDNRFDGRGEWLPLVVDGESRVEDMSVEEVLVYTRLAADKVGPTKMDRCEDVEPHLKTGKVYVACTNNSDRGAAGKAAPDEANPRRDNRDGHIIELTEDRDDQTSTTFRWNILMVCGDPAQGDATYFGGFPEDKVSPISCPDNVAFDSAGHMWIATDGAPSGIGYCDGMFRVTLEGKQRGRVEQFLSVPRDAEVCGPIAHDDDQTVFVNVQHPGEDGTWSAQRSSFPDYVAPWLTPAKGQSHEPRPTFVQVLKGKPGKNSPDGRQRGMIGDTEKGKKPAKGLAAQNARKSQSPAPSESSGIGGAN